MIAVLDQRSSTALLLVLFGLIVGTSLSAFAVGRRTWLRVPGAALAAAFVVAWLLLNSRIEGRTLIAVTDTNGLNVADLLALPALRLLVLLTWRAWQDR